ncbi:tudor domain-containing 6 isoform X2 [Melanotaenia boesemani]|uniref:tudor domain-containing 6 isoform X2 n=1 Tax=Melanotaenia boesemani TaxID=1250792 RepID=UPI001C05A9BA|nr:tudor domain-containing 6 isoform X2 [Melanotaenia boesemani]
MSSIPGLPTPGSPVKILITRVHLHPLCVLVEFWGKFNQDRAADYELLAKDIQSPGITFKDLEGDPGDKCLVRIDDTWYRSRIVSRNGSRYSVFLIDKGMTYSATASMLAWGKEQHFKPLPEVEFCVLANVLPRSLENKWSAVALEFLKTLTGKSVTAHVQDVLVPHRMFFLDIPCISQQMYEMGFAKKMSPIQFQNFVLMSLNSQGGAEASPDIQELSKGTSKQLHKQELFMYPELPGGTVENVVVTEVTNPQRIFCQLKVFSQELKKLSDQLTQSCEGRMSSCVMGPEMIGSPCAARGSDGRWYRSVLRQVFPVNKLVEVLNVDYGTKQLVQVENVRPLAAEFFRMPVVTYICSLHGLLDKGVGWTASQINVLRSLLLNKRMIARFEYQSISEGVYYVTLYGDDNINMNILFGSKESCLLEFEKTLGDYAVQGGLYNDQHPSQEKEMVATGQAVEEKRAKSAADVPPVKDLSLNSSHMAVVQHVANPSEFWIQLETLRKELDELVDSFSHLYQDSVSTDVVRSPTLGLYCAAKAEDGEFCRATVTEVGETQVKVLFFDYGNTEVVNRSNIRAMPSEFLKLPQLALKCSLDGVRPKAGKWSESASEFFIQAVTDKVLNVHIKAKYNEHYVVQLTDPEAQGEKDVGMLMCTSGLAERAEMQTRSKAKNAPQAAISCPAQPSDDDPLLPGIHGKSGFSFQTQSMVGLTDGNRRVATFKEQMFSIGRVLDVTVSYIESPNDFWCQLVQTAGCLKLLMQDMQAYYAGSEFKPSVEVACVARHPENRMWYRALLVHKHKTPHVDALFVDYGQTLTVSINDLRRICPEFLSLHGQAFRCSLLNPINPTSVVNEWSQDAKAMFQNFVETAASNHVVLKCTVYASMYSEQMVVYNIVDLETPFESICTSMANLVPSALPKKATRASFRLNTYYYSNHNVKTGTEEQVTVTYVKNVNEFYCHLDKNTDVMKDLKVKVSNLCHQLEMQKLPSVYGTLCFARYKDGEWYRAQIKATKPTILVHFVDYGDTIEVDKSDLLPVPKEAGYIMSVPVQAVVCGLSDVPAHVTDEVNRWFEMTVPESKMRALVVAREPDGKLLVELFHRNTQINAKIKKMSQIEMKMEQRVVYQGSKTSEASASFEQETRKPLSIQATDGEDRKQALKKKQFSSLKPSLQMRVEKKSAVNQQSAQKHEQHVSENGHRIKPTPLELYKPPHQRTSYGSELVEAQVKPRKENLPPDTKQLKSKPAMVSQKETDAEKLPKLTDLPSKMITPGTTVDVYVSHCNSPLNFNVQCVNDEEEMFSLLGKLNDPKLILEVSDLKDVNPGDLIQAEFAEDAMWYRAVVKEINDNVTAVIEYIDFGNTAVIPISKMARLHKSVLELPVYSMHCMLSDAAAVGEERALNSDVVSAFKKDVGGSGEKLLQCQFIRQEGSVWEVRLRDGDVDIVCKVPAGDPQITTLRPTEEAEKSQPRPLSLCYTHQQQFLEGQQLEAYITAINDAQTFWCQSANTEELDKIALILSEICDEADKHVKPEALLPGSLCIALYTDDQLWYRTEVISKDGEELSVLFVDYGNKSLVRITDVREMPPVLANIPPQGFLCELQGFDSLHGSWDSSAADELSTLTADKLLQLTIMRITRVEGKMKCLVQMECEGQVINEVMKTWWKCFTAEDAPDSTSLFKKLQLDSPIAAVDDQLQQPDIQCNNGTASYIHPELADLHTLEKNSNLASSPKSSESSEDLVSVESPKEELSIEEKVMSPEDVLPTDSGIDESMLLLLNNKDEDIMSLSYNVNVDSVKGEEDLDSPLEENMETIDELETEMADKEEMNPPTCSLDVKPFSEPVKVDDDGKTAVSEGTFLTTTKAVKMVPHKAAVQETAEIKQAELEHPSSVCPEQQFCEAEAATSEPSCSPVSSREKISQEEVHLEIEDDLCEKTAGEENDVQSESVESPLGSTVTQREAAHQEDESLTSLSNLVEELSCLVEKIHLTDVWREDSDQQLHTPQQNPENEEKDSDNSTLMEEMPSAEDSFEAQLSKITHLCLIIRDASADVLSPDQQPE